MFISIKYAISIRQVRPDVNREQILEFPDFYGMLKKA